MKEILIFQTYFLTGYWKVRMIQPSAFPIRICQEFLKEFQFHMFSDKNSSKSLMTTYWPDTFKFFLFSKAYVIRILSNFWSEIRWHLFEIIPYKCYNVHFWNFLIVFKTYLVWSSFKFWQTKSSLIMFDHVGTWNLLELRHLSRFHARPLSICLALVQSFTDKEWRNPLH